MFFRKPFIKNARCWVGQCIARCPVEALVFLNEFTRTLVLEIPVVASNLPVEQHILATGTGSDIVHDQVTV